MIDDKLKSSNSAVLQNDRVLWCEVSLWYEIVRGDGLLFMMLILAFELRFYEDSVYGVKNAVRDAVKGISVRVIVEVGGRIDVDVFD